MKWKYQFERRTHTLHKGRYVGVIREAPSGKVLWRIQIIAGAKGMTIACGRAWTVEAAKQRIEEELGTKDFPPPQPGQTP